MHIFSAHEAYKKAYIACKRLPKLERIIITDPFSSFLYAKAVIQGRWPEAEDTIMTDPVWSHDYAAFVIKGKLPEKMHNMMLLYAIKDSNNLWVKEYFELIK